MLRPHSPSEYPSLLLYILDEVRQISPIISICTECSPTGLFSSFIIRHILQSPSPRRSSSYTPATPMPSGWQSELWAHLLLVRHHQFKYRSLSSTNTSILFVELHTVRPCTICNTAKALKKLIRGPRPPPPPDSSASPVRPKKTYGMPSTHSTALTFYAAYMLPSLSSLPLPYLSGLGIVGYWAAGLWSRKELGYHTWEQIVAGALTGGVLTFIWRGIWNNWDVEGKLQPLIDHVWKAVVG